MNITSLPKDEMASHLAEVIDSQDHKILSLHQERRAWLRSPSLLLSYTFFDSLVLFAIVHINKLN